MTRPLVTLDEASRKLSVPIGTLHSWASRSRNKLEAASLTPEGVKLYLLDEIEALADKRTRRRPRS